MSKVYRSIKLSFLVETEIVVAENADTNEKAKDLIPACKQQLEKQGYIVQDTKILSDLRHLLDPAKHLIG